MVAKKAASRNKREVAPLQLRVSFKKSIAMGPGKADLLDAIASTGSISAAARELGMSYRRAWLLVETMNQSFREAIVETLAGGKSGGGARVTALGLEVVRRYRAMENKACKSVARELVQFAKLMAVD
jgi:molybdate transport system regulatory protein